MSLTPEQVAALAAIVAAIAGAGMRGLWVWGYQLREAKKEAMFWREIALQLLGVTEKATSATIEVTALAKRRVVDEQIATATKRKPSA